MLQVPSEINKDASKVLPKRKTKERKKIGDKENITNKKEVHFKSRNKLELISNFGDHKLQGELNSNIDRILHSNIRNHSQVVLKDVNNTFVSNRNKNNLFLYDQLNIILDRSVKSTDTRNKYATIISNESQTCDGIITKAGYKFSYDPKFNMKCMILLEKSDILSMKSSNETKANGQEKLYKSNSNNILQSSDDSIDTKADYILCGDPKLNLQCVIPLEKFDVKTAVEKKIGKLDCNSSLENIDCMKGTTVAYKDFRDPKLYLKCIIPIETFDVNSSNMKLLNKRQNTVEENIDKFISNNNETNYKNTLSIIDQNVETNRKVQIKLFSSDNFASNKKSCTEQENELSAKSKIITGGHINQSISPKFLRKQIKKNYAEVSLNDDKEVALTNSNFIKKGPIYKNQQNLDTKAKKPLDLYEFDESDSDKEKKYRKRKRNLNRSKKLDKTMYDILQKIRMKEVKLQAKNKIKENKHNQNLESIPKHQVIIVEETALNSSTAHKAKTEQCNKKFFGTPEHEVPTANNNGMVLKDNSGSEQNNEKLVNVPEHEVPTADSNSVINDDDSGSEQNSEEWFDFVGVNHSTPVKGNPNINIIGNVVLNQNDVSNLFNNMKPNANSTVLSNDKYSPWRFNERLKRNPHFLTVKRTALPCLQQDMVLDYGQVEKIEEHFSKTPKRIETPEKKSVQKSILDYMNVPSHDMSDKENFPHLSLFDYEDFSPKKTKSPDFSIQKAKRNILTPRQDNNFNTNFIATSPQNKARSPNISTENNDIDTYFGFDDDEVLPEEQTKLSNDRPYRINQSVLKKYPKKVAETELVEENLPDLQESFEPQPMPDGKEGRLFEDPEQAISINMPSKIYERKRKKKRLMSVDMDQDEHKKKKKNMMTKEEEAELEKWAKQFNIICEEIDKYSLDIE